MITQKFFLQDLEAMEKSVLWLKITFTFLNGVLDKVMDMD